MSANEIILSPGIAPADAEACTLASFLLDNSGVIRREIMRMVRPAAFLDADIRGLAGIAWRMQEEGKPIDAVTIRHEAENRGLGALMNVKGEIGRLLDEIPSPANGVHYALIVRRAWRKRWLLRESDGLRELLLNSEHDPIEVARTLRQRLDTFVEKATESRNYAGGAAELTSRIENILAGNLVSIALPRQPLCSELTNVGMPGSISMLAGTAGDGKTWLILAWLYGWRSVGIAGRALMMEETRDWHLHRGLAYIHGEPKLLNLQWCRENPDFVRDRREESHDEIEALGEMIDVADARHDTLDGVAAWIESEARNGARMIVVDPISAIDPGQNRWSKDQSFIRAAKKIVDRYGCSLTLVTHPKTGTGGKKSIKQDDLAGGAAFPRFTQCVMLLQKHEPATYVTVRKHGFSEHTYINRSLVILKARNGRGGGMRIGMALDNHLQWHEYGAIVRKKQPPQDANDQQHEEAA